MAKGKNKNRNRRSDTVKQRDFSRITNKRSVLLPTYTAQTDFTDVDDGRRYNPTNTRRPPKSVTGASSAYNYKSLTPLRVAFQQPEKVIVCIRRKIRKEVLHALKLTRKNGGGARKRTPLSDIHC